MKTEILCLYGAARFGEFDGVGKEIALHQTQQFRITFHSDGVFDLRLVLLVPALDGLYAAFLFNSGSVSRTPWTAAFAPAARP